MKEVCVVAIPENRMPNLAPGLYCGIVDMESRTTVQVGVARPKWESGPYPDPQPAALAEMAGVAVAAWPEANSGFVLIWIEVTADDA